MAGNFRRSPDNRTSPLTRASAGGGPPRATTRATAPYAIGFGGELALPDTPRDEGPRGQHGSPGRSPGAGDRVLERLNRLEATLLSCCGRGGGELALPDTPRAFDQSGGGGFCGCCGQGHHGGGELALPDTPRDFDQHGGCCGPGGPSTAQATDRYDGRYQGGIESLFLDLRIDQATCGVFSADLYRGNFADDHWLGSIRTGQGNAAHADGRAMPVVGRDSSGQPIFGQLAVDAPEAAGDPIDVTLTLERPIGKVPAFYTLRGTLPRTSMQLRTLLIQLEREQLVDPLQPYQAAPDQPKVTLQTALERAGYELARLGTDLEIPPLSEQWDVANLYTLLHDYSTVEEARPWEVRLMLLSASTDARLNGIMFEDQVQLARQGAAVFLDALEANSDPSLSEAEQHRRKLRTVLHELGHTLNLFTRLPSDRPTRRRS